MGSPGLCKALLHGLRVNLLSESPKSLCLGSLALVCVGLGVTRVVGITMCKY